MYQVLLFKFRRHLCKGSMLFINKHVHINSYYIDKSVLLGTKPLVDSIRHFIRDTSGIFAVCHLCKCRIVH